MNLPSTSHTGPRFRPGTILATPGALAALSGASVPPLRLLLRHLQGDWGEICDDDRRQNESALAAGERLLSCYCLPGGINVWIITERDRSSTTIVLPAEY